MWRSGGQTTYESDAESGTTCLICDTHNGTGAVLCSQCAAPLSLTLSTIGAERPPRLVTVLGDSNVGKTVYLGFLLDMLTQRARGFEAIPKGTSSVNLQQIVISHMAWRMFPPKTPMESDQWNWAYYEVCQKLAGRKEKWVDLITPDLAGEAIAAEVASPSTFGVIQKLLNKSAGLLLLVDAALAANGSSQPDFFALKLMSYVDSMASQKRGKKIDKPVALVLTKADYVPECFDNPRRFAQANLNRLWNICESRLANFEFFASSVVGSIGYAVNESDGMVTPVPLHTALHGVLEPFEWIVDKL
ncbi:MAG: hypothetical protein HZB38_03710 [Planctomycetes bacterium]|nr:hypothetical protein [Planctomycetota bacterium]